MNGSAIHFKHTRGLAWGVCFHRGEKVSLEEIVYRFFAYYILEFSLPAAFPGLVVPQKTIYKPRPRVTDFESTMWLCVCCEPPTGLLSAFTVMTQHP